MRKLVYFIVLFIIPIVGFSSCSKKENTEPVVKVTLPISGTYSWKFTIPKAGNQDSQMTFSNTNIVYKMIGDVYNNEYNMTPLSYDEKDKKIVAVGKGGVKEYSKEGKYFVIFLKDIDKGKVTIFKKEFEKKEDAEKFNKPADDSTDSHGWNIYTKQ